MSIHYTYIPYATTNAFSSLVSDYLSGNDFLESFYNYRPDVEGIKKAMEDRRQFPVNRDVLTETIQKQYKNIAISGKLGENIHLLKNAATFTICTAHQPNLLTGYLYFVYKILHAIKLAAELKKHFPENNFVPVYYMGSEDNDLDELGRFKYNGQKFIWDADGQTGAVGRMETKSLKTLLDALFLMMGPSNENTEQLKEIITSAYLQHTTVAKATQYLVNELFGKYGLIVLDADDEKLKAAFLPVMKDDVFSHQAHKLVRQQVGKLSAKYQAQAFPRPINLFYLKDGIRERIEKEGNTWKVLHTHIEWDEKSLKEELEKHPERFSPNVILRGVYQETILPNIVFIGGGSEVAYWMQLKPVFEHYHVFFPVVLLRQSVLWVNEQASKKMQDVGFEIEEYFKKTDAIIQAYLFQKNQLKHDLSDEKNTIDAVLQQLKAKAIAIDQSLAYSSEAVLKKIEHQIAVLEKKMMRADKKHHEMFIQRIEKIKDLLFPDGVLQERIENFMQYYIDYGEEYFDIILNAIDPLRNEFLIIKE